MIPYTEETDFTESHGKTFKKSRVLSVRSVDSVSKVFFTAIPNEPYFPLLVVNCSAPYNTRMNTAQASKTNWSTGVIIGSSIPIMLIVMGIIIALVSEFNTHDGIHDTTVMSAVLFGGLYLAIPCGLLNVIVGIFARSRGLVKKKVAITAIIIGVFGILLGLLSWASFYMVSSFVF